MMQVYFQYTKTKAIYALFCLFLWLKRKKIKKLTAAAAPEEEEGFSENQFF